LIQLFKSKELSGNLTLDERKTQLEEATQILSTKQTKEAADSVKIQFHVELDPNQET
jgi:hypothetical protein